MNPIKKFDKRVEDVNSLLCVGLDADFNKIPKRFLDMQFPQFEFNKWIIEETNEYAASFKINSAFYEARGEQGIHELKMTIDYLNQNHPSIFTIFDAKRGDIGNTNNGYVAFAFDWLNFDSITLHPYLGIESLMPFLERKEKGCIIMCRNSNPDSREFQNLIIDGKPLWQIMAESVTNKWNTNQNCILAVGATYPEEMKKIREITGDMTFLVPGIGAQGGSIKEIMQAGQNSKGRGLIIHSARNIIFSENPKEEAQKLRDEIRQYRK
ncbi:MAG: orotidine-5'-phosphate decarboxylase [Patescibacteria group bacterium]